MKARKATSCDRQGVGGGAKQRSGRVVPWPRHPLVAIAPAIPAQVKFNPDDLVWHLGLDKIESHTGAVLTKHRAAAAESGNSTFAFDEGNVLYSKLRPYLNKVVVPDEPGLATTELMPLRPRRDLVCREYLAHYLRSGAFLAFASQFVTGAKMPRVILDKFWAHKIPLPPLSEQCRIVEILDQADHLRRLRAEADAKADRILPALFIKMFRRGAHASQTERLEELVEIGGALVAPNHDDYLDLPHVGGKQIEKVTGCLLELRSVRDSRLRSGKFLFTSRHVLYSKIRPYLNKVAYPRFAGLCSADIYPLLPRDRRVGPWFLTVLLRSDEFLAYARGQSDRLRMPKLNREQLGSYPVLLPDSDALESFERRAEHLACIAERRLRVRAQFDSLFQVALHRGFEGDLTASWREAHMKELLQEMEQQAKALAEATP